MAPFQHVFTRDGAGERGAAAPTGRRTTAEALRGAAKGVRRAQEGGRTAAPAAPGAPVACRLVGTPAKSAALASTWSVMTAFCTMKLLCQATRNENRYAKRFLGTLLTQMPQKRVFSPFWMVVPDPRKSTVFGLAQPFCTAEKSHTEPKRKAAFGSVGRRIPYRIVHVISQDGESLGNMHRAEALKLMDQHDLKLVLLHENAEPPVYRLMTGQQIHEEQLKRAAKKKASPKPGMVQKELSFSSTIAKNDLETKTKQIAQWIEKKYHVKVTIRQAKDSNTDMFMLFDQILESMSEKATYLSKPKVTREGVSTCILRHMSDKELKAYQKMEKQKNSTVKKDENEDLKSNESHQ